jgi:hypothetical protein
MFKPGRHRPEPSGLAIAGPGRGQMKSLRLQPEGPERTGLHDQRLN